MTIHDALKNLEAKQKNLKIYRYRKFQENCTKIETSPKKAFKDYSARMINGRRAVIGSFVLLAFTLYYINIFRTFNISSDKMVPKPRSTTKYALNTPGCQIPLLDPMHPSVASLVSRKSPLVCTRKLPAPVIPGENPKIPSVRLVKDAVKKHGSNIACSYVPLQRKSEGKTIEGKSHPIDKSEVNITDEFIKVECFNKKSNSNVYRDFFPFIQKKKDVEERCKNSKVAKEKDKSKRFSVLLLGMDSVSKNQYLRHMKRTEEYLKNLTFVELHGYNKIGKNTYPNMVPLMTGYLETEVEDTSKKPANVLPLIWKDFAKAGYKTLFSEDIPQISIFNYARKGFSDQPTDYYLRPFSVAVESSSVVKKGKRGCFNHRLEADVVLNWTGDFFDTFPEDPLFALTFLSRLSHDNLNELSLQDEPYRRFLQRMNDSGHLNRTIVFFFSDHGFRFGDIRTTYIGRIEGKLPFMFILVPPWFPSTYPTLFEILKVNSERLTSPLDIYATLQGILHFPEKLNDTSFKIQNRSMDLFNNVISENRTCESANIPFQMCACTKLQQVMPSEKHVVKAAQKIVDKINEFTKNYRNRCSEVKMTDVKSATIELVHLGESSNDKASTNYQVTVLVEPSNGLFEGTVWHFADKDKYTAMPGIERVNMYGNQSSCINIASLKPYCYCSVD